MRLSPAKVHPCSVRAPWISAVAGMTARTLAIDASGARACAVGESRWIPAFAGMTEEGVPAVAVRTLIPAFAGMTEEGVPGRAVRTLTPAFRGNDGGMRVRTATAGTPSSVIPAKAGVRVRTARPGTPSSVIPAKAGVRVRTARPGTPSSVIPAEGGSPSILLAIVPSARLERPWKRTSGSSWRLTSTDSSQRKCGWMIRSMNSSTCSMSGAAGWMVTCSMPASSSVLSLATMSPTLPSR